jgi:adenine-specific DNA methylase
MIVKNILKIKTTTVIGNKLKKRSFNLNKIYITNARKTIDF